MDCYDLFVLSLFHMLDAKDAYVWPSQYPVHILLAIFIFSSNWLVYITSRKL
jgi:hypothetical protein